MGKFLQGLSEELSLYVRQLAWLRAVPRDPRKPIDREKEPISRGKQMEKDGIEPALPPCRAVDLVNWLMEIGPTVSSGWGQSAIGWRDLSDWQSCTGIALTPWEARTLRRLSGDYSAELSEAEDIFRPSPFAMEERIEANRDAVSRKVDAILGMRG